MPVSDWSLLPEEIAARGYPRDARQLFGAIHRVWRWQDGKPLLNRDATALGLDLTLPRIVEEVQSSDGATRIVLALHDDARIEAVHMPRNDRVTVCLSSQVGCAMGCTFCATAKMGLVRNLTAAEIIGQLFAVLQKHGPTSAKELTLVFMGMGEPLHNVTELIRALEVLCDPAGLGVAPSRITVSTAGHVAGLERLATCKYIPELAISVNAATDEARTSLMPINKRWSLTDLRAALSKWPKRPHSKITLEYVLLKDQNDDLASADLLAEWTGDLRHILNVIPFNEWDGATVQSSDRVAEFVERLRSHGCLVTVRYSRGRDVRAACGTLVSRSSRSGSGSESRPLLRVARTSPS